VVARCPVWQPVFLVAGLVSASGPPAWASRRPKQERWAWLQILFAPLGRRSSSLMHSLNVSSANLRQNGKLATVAAGVERGRSSISVVLPAH